MSETPARERRTALGCGCGGAVALVLAVIMGLAWLGYGTGERFRQALADPEARDAASREILGYETLPAGYHPMGGFSVPFVMDMAMLSDRQPPPGEEIAGPREAFEHRGFVFLATRARGSREREVRELLRGERERAEFFEEIDQAFERQEVLGRGRLQAGGAEVLYLAERGRLDLSPDGEEDPEADPGRDPGRRPAPDPMPESAEGPQETFLTRFLFECPDGGRLRVGTWFEAAPGGDAGTPADPEAARRFLDHFDLCG
ncbi:MAG: hypothetical protein ACLF0P_11935 [Thermoanaerobaculia bacterium]